MLISMENPKVLYASLCHVLMQAYFNVKHTKYKLV